MLTPIRTVAPAVPVVTFTDLDLNFRLDSAEDSRGRAQAILDASIAHFDGWSGILGRCMINQTWKVSFEKWEREYRLPFPDVSAVSGVYYDTENAEQAISSSNYELLSDARGSFIRFKSTFSGPNLRDYRSDVVQFTITAGYGAAASDVPADIRLAIILHVKKHFDAMTPEAIAATERFIDSISEKYRRTGF